MYQAAERDSDKVPLDINDDGDNDHDSRDGDEYQGTESDSDKVPLHNLFVVLDVLIRHRADLPL